MIYQKYLKLIAIPCNHEAGIDKKWKPPDDHPFSAYTEFSSKLTFLTH